MPYVPDVARIGLIPPFFLAHQNIFGTAPDENSSGEFYKIAAFRSGKTIDASIAWASHGRWDRRPDKTRKGALLAEKSIFDIKTTDCFLYTYIKIYRELFSRAY